MPQPEAEDSRTTAGRRRTTGGGRPPGTIRALRPSIGNPSWYGGPQMAHAWGRPLHEDLLSAL